jgi:leucyl aminopeptidase
MRYVSATAAKPTDPLLCFDQSAAFRQLPTALRNEAAHRFERGDLAVMPGLGLVKHPLVVVARSPDWTDLVTTRRRAGAMARTLIPESPAAATLQLPEQVPDQALRALLLGLAQGAYRWDRYRSEPGQRLERLRVIGAPRASLAAAQAAADAIALCRDLINTPAEDLGPAEFVSRARSACRGTTLSLRVLDEAQCRKLGMGCLTAVGRASPRRPRLLGIDYPGGGRGEQPLELCGKGVCFDTGGLNIKAASGME